MTRLGLRHVGASQSERCESRRADACRFHHVIADARCAGGVQRVGRRSERRHRRRQPAAASTSQSAITTMEGTVIADLAIVQSGVSTIGNQISAVNNLVVTLTSNIGVAESAAATAGAAAASATNSASASSGSAATAATEAGIATTQADDAATSASAAASSATSAATSASAAAATAAAIAAAGVLEGQGTWNASTNTPTLASGTGTKGYAYIVSTAGTTTLDGISSWNASDWAYFDGTVWRKIDGVTLEVSSVAGLSGVVTESALRTAIGLGSGTSVIDPGSGNIESVLPVQTITGTNHAFVAADLYKETRRSNSGATMTDTFPASTTTGLANGTRIQLNNSDATATLTVSAGAGTTINSTTSAAIGPGRSTEWVYDLGATNWRPTMNSLTALLAANNLSEVASPSTALANLGGAPLASPALTGTPTHQPRQPTPAQRSLRRRRW